MHSVANANSICESDIQSVVILKTTSETRCETIIATNSWQLRRIKLATSYIILPLKNASHSIYGTYGPAANNTDMYFR